MLKLGGEYGYCQGKKDFFLPSSLEKKTLPESRMGMVKMQEQRKSPRDFSGSITDKIAESEVTIYMVNKKNT